MKKSLKDASLASLGLVSLHTKNEKGTNIENVTAKENATKVVLGIGVHLCIFGRLWVWLSDYRMQHAGAVP